MSYCVNCGVELEASLKKCPLCHTPVINPNEITTPDTVPPFPEAKGQVDSVKRKDLALLTIIVLLATSLSCLLLNLFVYPGSLWSLFIIGSCLILFVFMLPVLFQSRFPIYISLLFDGAAIGIFLFLATYNTSDSLWFFKLGLPLVALITILAEILALLIHSFPFSFLHTGIYVFAEIALLCVGIELLTNHFRGLPCRISWSAIVLTVCTVILITLTTLLSVRRLREAVRRRLHF